MNWGYLKRNRENQMFGIKKSIHTVEYLTISIPNQWISLFACPDWLLQLGISCSSTYQTSEQCFSRALIGYSRSGYPPNIFWYKTKWTCAREISFRAEFGSDKIHFLLLHIYWFGIYYIRVQLARLISKLHFLISCDSCRQLITTANSRCVMV